MNRGSEKGSRSPAGAAMACEPQMDPGRGGWPLAHLLPWLESLACRKPSWLGAGRVMTLNSFLLYPPAPAPRMLSWTPDSMLEER